jgi:Chaperone of endosialidase
MKIEKLKTGAILLALFSAVNVYSQNVGIGVSSPKSMLSINGTTSSGGLAIGDTNYTSTAGIIAPTNGAMIEGQVAIGTTAPDANAQLTIIGPVTGNIGPQIDIRGISSSVYGGTPNFFLENGSGSAAAALLYMQNSAGNKGFLLGTDVYYKNISQFYIQDIAAGRVTRLTIDPNGNVGIGTETPQVSLHVPGQVYVAGNGVTGEFWDGTANQDGVQINPGWIGIQRGAAGNCIHLSKPSGSGGNLAGFFVAGVGVGSITTNGTSTQFNTTSDVRLKENIRPTTKGLNDVMRIEVSDFNFRSTPGKTETGFIAQQLYTVLPEVVTRGGQNPAVEPWTVDYGHVTPLLTKAIQDQQRQIDDLKGLNKHLSAVVEQEKATIAEQGAQIAGLKAANEKLAVIAARIDALEKAVNTKQGKEKSGVQTVALEQ